MSDGVIFDNCVKLLALESLSSLSTVREAVGNFDEVSDNFSLADPDDDVALAFVRLGARLWPDALRRSVDVLPSDLARFVTEMGDGVWGVRKYLLLHSPASSMMARREKDKRPKRCPKSI
ncbi:hypothetical protein [Cutibacterium acnes]|uniref:hypothetical protein n=1 Tax=Cutibacterium acnes TaxID=1747 RepID=UPI001F36EF32|nr:hypothetical protein [Cutibacterium acnes]